MLSLFCTIKSFFCRAYRHVYGWFRRSPIRKVFIDRYLKQLENARQRISSEQAAVLSTALEEWLFDSNHRGDQMVRRAAGMRFLQHRTSIVLEGKGDAAANTEVVEFRPMIEAIITPQQVYFGVFEAYNDGDRKTAARYRVNNPRALRRLQFHYISQYCWVTGDCQYIAVSHHHSEFSYYRSSPLAAFCVPVDTLPESIQALVAQAHWDSEN